MTETRSEEGCPLTLVIPIYNEAESLPDFLPKVLQYCETRGWQVVFVDDGSKDSSLSILQTLCAGLSFCTIVRHKVNKGYGGALKSGIKNVRTPFVLTLDSDGQHQLADIDRILAYMIERNADLVVGKRSLWSSTDYYREAGKWIIRKFTALLMPLPIQDLNSGFKLYRTNLVQRYLLLCPDSMAFSDVITLIFIHQRHLVDEIPITINKRKGGKSTISTRTAFETVIEILNLTMLFDPLRIFLPLSVFCLLIGFIWGTPFVLMGRGVSVGAMLAIVVGVLFFFLGLIASQLSAIRLSMIAGTTDEPRS